MLQAFFDNIYNWMAVSYSLVGKNISSFIAFFLSALAIMDTPYFLIGLFATRKFKPAKNNHKYAVLIPARNEESVIANLIESIHKQDYPQELITVFVIADNCTDSTAKIARENGAVCYERFNDTERTKGFALKYLFERIDEDYGIESFEGYFIFDSDNLLKKDYISRMNDSFDAGEKIITSYRTSKNFDENWVASTYAIHWLRSIRIKHRARSVLHLATNIQGTGFLFSNEIVKDGWKYTSLTEDRALTADAVVDGYEISYNDAAIFYDEQPVSLRVALRQRLRWSRGHLLAFVESGWGLFKNIFVDHNTIHKPTDKWYNYPWRTIRHRFMSFDTFAQLCPKSVISTFKWLLFVVLWKSFYDSKTGLYSGMFGIKYIYSYTFKLFNIIKFNIFNPLFDLFGIDNIPIFLGPGTSTVFKIMLITIYWRILYRICSYVVNIWMAIYIFIVERKRIKKISLPKKMLFCFTWPTFDIIDRYTKYVALFKKVEWKPIPHNSKITIDDISSN